MAVSLPMTVDSISRRLFDFTNKSMMSKMMWWRQPTYQEVEKEAEKTATEAISKSVESIRTIDVKNRIQMIAQSPASMLLAVYGEKDDVIDPSPTRELNGGSWANVRPIGLADSKHFPMLDEASKFHRLLLDFLEVEGDLSVLELKEEWRRRTR
jgi:hypothetical protein